MTTHHRAFHSVQLSRLGRHRELCVPPGFPERVRRGTLAFKLMFFLGRIGRRIEAQPETNP